MSQPGDWAERLIEAAWDPAASRKVLDTLTAHHTSTADILQRSPDSGIALLNFLTFSPVSFEKVTRRPELLEWLTSSDVLTPRRGGRSGRRAEPVASDASYEALRGWKSQEMLRIAFREIAGLADFSETTRDITEVAEICVGQVYQGVLHSLAKRWGDPDTGFGILAMGKFGGYELNYSSDIDVIFFYGEDGYLNPRFTFHEFFTRLAEKIIEVFSVKSVPLFRIDLRLRPEGGVGPLVRSFASLENYYAGYGETWERMALIKARGICGDEELLYEFEHRLQPFIFPRAVSADLLEEIADLKVRIERDLVGAEDLHRNVKLGFGGIREIEFIVQTLQLLHGARNAFLQERGSMKALTALEQLQILPREDVDTLRKAYIFLRAVEHRLQIVNEQQTHTLPAKTTARLPIARSLGFGSVAPFDQNFSAHTHAVRRIFERLLGAERESPKQERVLDFFHEPGHAEKSLTHLRDGPSNVHVAPRTRRLYAKLQPELLRRLRHLADPDGTLNRFTRFVDGYGIRGLLFETLLANPRLFELLLQLFDASAVFSQIVIRRPQLVEEVARGRTLGRRLKTDEFADGLSGNSENLPVADWIRAYRRAEMLRILLRDVLGFASLEELQTEMTDLAEACLRFAMAALETPNALTVLALGKIGGRELLYGADLDLVFIGQESAPAEKLISLMSAKTSEGRVFSIDCRLRPEGGSAPLVVSTVGYEAYFAKRAQLWEIQALTKSRVLCGPEAASLAGIVDQIWSRPIDRRKLRSGVYAMYQRIVRERSKHPDDLSFKTGRGGLVAIEFLVQFFQMRDGIRESNTLAALDKLTLQLSDAERETLRNAYRFLRKLESVLRRVDNVSASTLPANEEDQRRVAKWMGFESREPFLDEYRGHRERVALIVDGHMA